MLNAPESLNENLSPIKLWHTSLFVTLFIIFIYNLIFIDKYFPYTEGWFSFFAQQIMAGKMPYKDFYCFLPPLYPAIITGITKIFNNDFIVLRFIGLGVMLMMAYSTFFIYSRLFPVTISGLLTVFSIIYYESNLTFITYDFMQFVTCFILLSLQFLLLSNNALYRKQQKLSNFYLIAIGFFAACSFYTKQSNGLIALMFIFFAVNVSVILLNKSVYLSSMRYFFLGMLIPSIPILSWIYFNGAFYDFIQQCFVGGVQSKGSINTLLFGWVLKWFSEHNFKKILIISGLIAIIVSFIRYDAIAKKKQTLSSVRSSVNQYYLYEVGRFVLCLLCIFIPLYSIEFSNYLVHVKKFRIFQSYLIMLTTDATIVVALYFFIKEMKLLINQHANTSNLRDINILVTLIVSLGLLLGTGPSAAIGDLGAAFGVGLIAGFIFPDKNRHEIVFVNKTFMIFLLRMFQYSCIFISFMMMAFFASKKYITPYSWWQLKQPDIRQVAVNMDIPSLKGLKLSTDTANIIAEIRNIILQHTTANENIFVYPHIPIFYLLTNRIPNTFSYVHWFDVLPDAFALRDAKILLHKPPKVIILMQPPEIVYKAHETYFRNGKMSGQRQIVAAIEKLHATGLYTMLKSYNIDSDYVLKVLVRKE